MVFSPEGWGVPAAWVPLWWSCCGGPVASALLRLSRCVVPAEVIAFHHCTSTLHFVTAFQSIASRAASALNVSAHGAAIFSDSNGSARVSPRLIAAIGLPFCCAHTQKR